MRRRSYSRPDLAYAQPGIVERTGGSYDLGGVWRPANYGPYTFRFNHSAYNRSLHAGYYNLEDDYYGSYGDLLEYEAALRMNRHLSEQERLRRWRMRLAFEELEEAERLRRYRSMAHTDRLLLGLSDHSWWGERYGSHPYHHRPDWRSRFGNKIRRWDSSFLPLSSSLSHRYAPVWGDSISLDLSNPHLSSHHSRYAHNGTLHADRLLDSERRLQQDIQYHELNNAERRLENQEHYLRDQVVENDIRHNQERALENQMMDNVLYDQERMYDQERRLDRLQGEEMLYDQERHLDRLRGEEMLYDQERRLENRLGDEELYRMERRLDDDTRYLQDTEVLDADLRDSVLDDYNGYPDVALQNDLISVQL
ncbi:hypothetical protein PCANC_04901 [Puccinia coronata f. sp. avenae]|uniref:Uncharacterized protein n=1 Tax=Puccinia coronata f. sp. avenae TaxID=200324 RepID=A0A2N5VF46_9BASI|nr:hypothetical protein PCANC_18111 [Puccinia coronata f. sp. avenae]PLW16780.1 hypothetical protein PCASD_17167 [Puccinia coronata f. sp. avenae]PLW48622.1 hypothetical protein PCASD_03385 [Puccinia coronata f. sp. avenae]PLW54371.1 hypothetical protein PCANC_04901 [Puccinia coronata f. sp. avenae]